MPRAWLELIIWLVSFPDPQSKKGGGLACVLYRGSGSNTSLLHHIVIRSSVTVYWRKYSTRRLLTCMFQIVAIETGGLFNLAVDLMQLFSENTTYVGCMQQVMMIWITPYTSPSLLSYLSSHLPALSLAPFSSSLLHSLCHSFSSFLSHLCHFSDFSPLLDALGLFFQIRDDYANLKSKEVWSINHKHIINFSMYQFCIALYKAKVMLR